MPARLPDDLQFLIVGVHDFCVELERECRRVEQPLSARMLALGALTPIAHRKEWQQHLVAVRSNQPKPSVVHSDHGIYTNPRWSSARGRGQSSLGDAIIDRQLGLAEVGVPRALVLSKHVRPRQVDELWATN